MKLRNFTAVGLTCPYCYKTEKKHIQAFEYSENGERVIRCSKCRRPILIINNAGVVDYKLDIPCSKCGEHHKFKMPVSQFWRTAEKQVFCPMLDEPVFVVGFDENVDRVLSEEFIDDDDENLNDDMLFSRLSESMAFKSERELLDCFERFKLLTESGMVRCTCSGGVVQLLVEENGFRLVCTVCGREAFYGFSTRDEIEKILSLDEILLK